MSGADTSGRLDAVEERHAQVHQHHVGTQLGRQTDRLQTVTGRTDDLNARYEPEQQHQPLTYDGLIVHDEHTHAHHWSTIPLPSAGSLLGPSTCSRATALQPATEDLLTQPQPRRVAALIPAPAAAR
ncbi:hypothetical protein GCM10020001_097440 [Nonomuraea salmonea]